MLASSTARTAADLGPRKGTAENYAVDATYVISDAWQLTAWVSRNKNQLDQATCENASSAGVCANTATDPFWQVTLRNVGDSGGLGLRARPFSKLELGADLQHSVYSDEYRQLTTTPAATTPTFIPDIETRVTTIRLSAPVAVAWREASSSNVSTPLTRAPTGELSSWARAAASLPTEAAFSASRFRVCACLRFSAVSSECRCHSYPERR